MSEQSSHILLHLGAFIEIQRLEADLDQAKIPCLIKNNYESAKLAGFGALHANVELYVFEKDFETASQILKNLLDEIN
jgi:hypothetical protein